MKQVIHISFMIFLVSAVFACSGQKESSSKQVTILHNKVEIDAPLKAFAKVFQEENDIEVVVKTCGGDACNTRTQLRADINAGEAPDIFFIEGPEDYYTWSDYIADLSKESWTSLTDLAFIVDDKVVGFPVVIEGWGMGYNKDLLDKAGIDPAMLTNYNAYKMAFKKLDSMKSTLGIDSVVSMTAGSRMHWVTASHNINSYLSNGLARNDKSILNLALEGKVDKTRLREYALWVKLLFDYSNQRILIVGDYDEQLNAFATQKAVFIHQGNWIEPNLSNANAAFPRAYAPHGSSKEDTDGVFVSAPSWYVVNKEGNVAGAKAFLKFMAESEQGHDYMVHQIQAIPAFKNVTLKPTAPLSASLLEWAGQGKTYAWNQYYLPDDFRYNVLGPLFEQFAKKDISLDTFVQLLTDAFATLSK